MQILERKSSTKSPKNQRPPQGIQKSLISYYCHEADNSFIVGHSLAPADKDIL